jgi:hypothetical protein
MEIFSGVRFYLNMSMSSYTLEVGKDDYKQTLEIKLPQGNRIGVLVSGGADSAILLYILAKLNLENNSPCTLIPFTVPKTDGSRPFAEIVVGYVSHLLDVSLDAPIIVGDATLHHSKQVLSGRNQAIAEHNLDCIVYGSQQVPPRELIDIDWEYPFRPDQIDYIEEKAYCPFALLDKRHTLDLYRIFDRFDLLSLTHSCTMVANGRCYKCFNCIERDWALNCLGIKDPGTL